MTELWARIGSQLFPPTIHPMVVHFPIALLYLTTLFDFLAVVLPHRRSRTFHQVGLWLLSLGLVSLVAAALAGIISESAAHFTPATRALLSVHQRDAFLTGLLASGAWIVQVMTPFAPAASKESWSLAGRGRVSWVVLALVASATAMVSITGSLGGTMVYGHGVGVGG
ncbi:MAG: DUF2231 domain-containing protein [Firmicutes bacterium]|nr:DUF2231 domain-containing protein [Bacillota bacterium]